MKIFALTKRVEDPEMKIKIKADGSGIATEGIKYALNPFDEIAVEEALRLKEKHGGEVVAVCIGVDDAQTQLRTALAMGADRAVHVVHDGPLDSAGAARVVAKLAGDEKPELILLGKQAVDDDAGQTGGILAETLQWGFAGCASKKASLESDDEKNKVPGIVIDGGRAQVVREVDGGIETLSVALPAVVTCELRLNLARYASLPNIMKAKKKEIRRVEAKDVGTELTPSVKVVRYEAPATRKQGEIVADVKTLVDKLRQQAKVL